VRPAFSNMGRVLAMKIAVETEPASIGTLELIPHPFPLIDYTYS
jgi:hypothetical protein